MTVHAIIVAAGRGTRMNGTGGTRKQFVPLNGRPVISRTLSVFDRHPSVDRIILVIHREDLEYCRKNILGAGCYGKPVKIVPGGRERQDSVYSGLTAVGCRNEDIVVIHDGVRPFVSGSRLTACINEAENSGACILGVPVSDTLKRADTRGVVRQTLPRESMWRAQTPQAFRYQLIKKAHDNARKSGTVATDDAFLLEQLGQEVKIIQGGASNIKITTREDLLLAEALSRILPLPKKGEKYI